MNRFAPSAFILLMSLGAWHAGGADEPPDPLQAFGLKPGIEYKAAKATLLASGWSVEPPSDQHAALFPAAPEIECGSGFDAICSAGFSKGAEAFGLVVERRGTSFFIIGTY